MQQELVTSTGSLKQEPIEQSLSSKQTSWGTLPNPTSKSAQPNQLFVPSLSCQEKKKLG